MNDKELAAAIEAILFTMGDSVEIDRIAAALEMGKAGTERILNEMAKRYEEEDRGIRLIRLENAWQLCTKKQYYDILIRIARTPRRVNLTEVLMETLSIVAYKQPVTKLEIEKIRGVKSDHAVNKLVEYNLVREVGRLDAPGRPILFGTTEEFLRHFGVDAVDELPMVDPVRKEDFKLEAEKEIDQKLKV
ncbi:MAG: SMC-Scp complex subunit ScpB [Lachnospiraceae bacterium]|nr:SMC-Scp complex subunit ScpB [Lachnospiraceae bacterium]